MVNKDKKIPGNNIPESKSLLDKIPILSDEDKELLRKVLVELSKNT